MMDEPREDQAIEFLLGQMDEREAAIFRGELAHDAELREYVRQLSVAVGSLAFASAITTPPPALLGRILEELRPSPALVPQTVSRAWIPWALAACLAVACGSLSVNHLRLRRELGKVRLRAEHTQQQLAQLQQRDELAQIKIATLNSKAAAYAKVAAVVLWNAEKQRGIVKFGALPHLDGAHDYQLWVIDPTQPKPVSAGVVAVDAAGAAQVAFHPETATPSAAQFALSIEPKGGGSAPKGQIVLAGQ